MDLALSPVPIEIPLVGISLCWHARSETDAGHAWFRDLVARTATELAARAR